MRLDENRTLFLECIEKTSVLFDVRVEYIEKDYWLVLLLKRILSNDYGYVFKGGTSLSKCHHLINRFSEDIDISYDTDYHTLRISDIERKFKGISKSIKEIGLGLENTNHLRRGAYFNRFICPYPSLFDEKDIAHKVIVELAAQTPSFPSVKKPIQSFVGEYLEKIGRHDLVELYDLGPFEIVTQSLERTLVDKTFAICDYYLSNKCKGHSRHIYDISKIMSVIDLDSTIVVLFKQVREYRKDNPICYSASESFIISELVSEIIDKDSFKEDYNQTTFMLLYEQYA